jgi:hypothetical protein
MPSPHPAVRFARPPGARPPSPRRRMLAGAAAGAWVAGRMKESAAGTGNGSLAGDVPPMIDWEQARSLAVNMNRGGALTAPARAELDARYRDLVRAVRAVGRGLHGRRSAGRSGPDPRLRPGRLDQRQHRRLPRMFEPLEALNPLLSGKQARPAAPSSAASTGRWSAASSACCWGTWAAGCSASTTWRCSARSRWRPASSTSWSRTSVWSRSSWAAAADFRMWLALHEYDPRLRVRAHPWLRLHFNGCWSATRAPPGRRRALSPRRVKGLGLFVDRVRTADHGGGAGWRR